MIVSVTILATGCSSGAVSSAEFTKLYCIRSFKLLTFVNSSGVRSEICDGFEPEEVYANFASKVSTY